jgi:amidohydrolase
VSLLVEDTIVAIPGVNDVVQLSPGMGAEDFAFFLQEAPGCFYNLGVGNKERGLNGPAHHPLFDLDESALKIGAKTLAINGLELLKRKDLHKK